MNLLNHLKEVTLLQSSLSFVSWIAEAWLILCVETRVAQRESENEEQNGEKPRFIGDSS